MKSIAIKLATGVATVGSLSGGIAYGIHKYSDTTGSVEHYLKKNQISIIAESDDTFWTKVHKTYELEKTSSGLEIDNKTINGKDDIKNWCHSEKNSLIKDAENTLYEKVKKWCTQYKTIGEMLGEGKQLNDSASDLNNKYTNLKPDLKKKINKITAKSIVNATGEKFKEWCEINSYRSYLDDQEEFANDIKTNCLKG